MLLQVTTIQWSPLCVALGVKNGNGILLTVVVAYSTITQIPGVLEGPEKSKVKKWHHPMFVQPILSQKNQKSKFFN